MLLFPFWTKASWFKSGDGRWPRKSPLGTVNPLRSGAPSSSSFKGLRGRRHLCSMAGALEPKWTSEQAGSTSRVCRSSWHRPATETSAQRARVTSARLYRVATGNLKTFKHSVPELNLDIIPLLSRSINPYAQTSTRRPKIPHIKRMYRS